MSTVLSSYVIPDVDYYPVQPKSSLISRNITVRGHRTSIRLEPEMWDALKDIAHREGTTIHNIAP